MKKITTPVLLLILMSLLFSACAPQAAATVTPAVPTAAATAVPPTAVPPTAVPPTAVPAPDYAVLWFELVAGMPADKGYGTVAVAKLNEELVEKAPFLLDVREAAEFEKDGYIEGSVNLPVRDVLKNLDKLPALDQPIVVTCASGHRGAFVMSALRLLGYSSIRNLAGGINAWKKAEMGIITSAPEAPKAGTAPEIKDQALFTALDGFFTGLPEGFFATNATKLNTDLTETAQLFILDVRTTKEYDETGRIAGATNIPLSDVFTSLDKLPADKSTPIVVYCVSGHRAGVVTMGLQMLGYEKAINLGGGINAWKAAKFPIEGWVDWNATWSDLLTNLPDDFYATSAANLNAALSEAAKPFVLDVREAGELEKEGYIDGAIHLPVRELLKNLDKLPALDQKIVIYCASGHRGALAAAALRILGYTDVVNLGGGLGAWKKANLPTVTGIPADPTAGTVPTVDATAFKQIDEYLTNLPEGFSTITSANLNAALVEASKPVVVDVREASEIEKGGMIEGSLAIPVREMFARLAELPKDKTAPIVITCASGHRGALALMALQMTGYTNVRNLGGGMNAWLAAALPVVK